MSTKTQQTEEENEEENREPDADFEDLPQDMDAEKIVEIQAKLLEKSTKELEQTQSILDAVKAKNDQLIRAYQELKSEHEMSVNRHRKALEDSNKYACTDFAKLLIVALDYLMNAMKLNTEKPSVYLGLKMGYDQLEQELKKHGILKMYCELGSMPNTNLHEVIGYEESDEYPAGTIVKVEKDGYVIHDRILRYASVKVVKGS